MTNLVTTATSAWRIVFDVSYASERVENFLNGNRFEMCEFSNESYRSKIQFRSVDNKMLF